MNQPITSAKIVLVADHTREPAAAARMIRRYRLARLTVERRPSGLASGASLPRV